MCLSIIAGGDKMKFFSKYGFEEIIDLFPILYILRNSVLFLAVLYTLYIVGTMIVKLAML